MVDKIVFGSYGQYAFSDRKRPMVWQVIEEGENQEVLVVATELLEKRPYHRYYHSSSWWGCELRSWLNEEFAHKTFTMDDVDSILYKGTVCDGQECYDWVTIPRITDPIGGPIQKSLRVLMKESEEEGYWLREAVDDIHPSYRNTEKDVIQGMLPERALSILPMMWLDKNVLDKRIQIREWIENPQQGVLLGSTFYIEGQYIRTHTNAEGNWVYILDAEQRALLVGCLSEEEETFIFPGIVDGYKVVGILGEYRNRVMKNLIIQEGIEYIGEEAIVCCEALETVSLPKTLKKLPGSNFVRCQCLRDIQIAKDHEFFSRDFAAVYSKDKKTFIKYIPATSYAGYTIPESVQSIEPGALADAHLWDLELPSSMKEILPYTFAYAQVHEVWLPEGLQCIGAHAFEYSKVQVMKVPETVLLIDKTAYAGCSNLQTVVLPERFNNRVSLLPDSPCEGYEERVERSSAEAYMNAGKGSVVTFGNYMQSMTGAHRTPILWEVLKREENHLLLIACDALYETVGSKLDAANQCFYEEAFSETEKKCILTKDGNAPVFCLNKEEVSIRLPMLKKRVALRTEYHSLQYGARMAQWWLRKDGKEDLKEQEMYLVDRDGGITVTAEYDECSVRPVIWVDLEEMQKRTFQKNTEYIREWFLEHNEYLAFRADQEELLDILVEYVVIFEKLAGLNPDDILLAKDAQIQIMGGTVVDNEEAEFILKLINYDYAYLDLDKVKRSEGYRYLHLYGGYENGILTLPMLKNQFDEWYQYKMRQYKNNPFDRIVYVVNHKVFYADQPLNEDELAYISTINSADQDQYDIDHNENGGFNCW